MGGGNPQPATIVMPAPDNSAILALIAQMESDQAAARDAAEKAQKEAMLKAEENATSLAKKQGEYMASQNLSRLEQVGAMKDAAALEKQKEQVSAAGSQLAGGVYDPNAVAQSRLQNLGAASGTLPSTPSNLAAAGAASGKNPALTTAASNLQNATGAAKTSFQLPETEGLILGGS